MKLNRFAVFGISVFFLFSLVGTNLPFAQSDSCISCTQILPHELELYQDLFPLTIWTDSHIYDHNSIVTLNGHLRPENTVSPILIVVTNPIGNIVTVEQIIPKSNGDFSFNLNTKSPLWKQDGDYVVKAQSGSDTRQFKTQFTLVTYSSNISDCSDDEISVIADNGAIYCIPFTTKNPQLNADGKLELATKTLSIKIRGQDSDSVALDIPRYLLDSKSSSGIDSPFIVLNDGKIIDFKEVSHDSVSRQIQFNYIPKNSHIYQIVGTHVVPEFGSIVMLILICSISVILLIGRSFSNRFVKL